MGSAASIVSAIAASIAACFAALNLIVTGRREHKKWAREALVEIITEFIDASFDSKDAAKRAIRNGRDRWPIPAQDPRRVAARDSERKMRKMQSRLRLLAPPGVIDAAQELRVATCAYIDFLDLEYDESIARDRAQRGELWRLRQEMLDQARLALALPRTWRRRPRVLPSEAFNATPD